MNCCFPLWERRAAKKREQQQQHEPLESHLQDFLRTDDLRRLRCCLHRLLLLPADHQAAISLSSFFASLRMTASQQDICSPFFSFLRTGQLTFPVFGFYLWNFLTLSTEASLSRQLHGLLSPVGTDVVCERHLLQLLKRLNPVFYGEHSRVLYEALSGVRHNCHTFSLFCKEFPSFLAPVREIQHKLQREILGSSFWTRCTVYRSTHDSENGLDGLREVVKYYYTVNTSQILKNRSSGCNELRSVLKKVGIGEFLRHSHDLLRQSYPAEKSESCGDCCDKFSSYYYSTLSPSVINSKRLSLNRVNSDGISKGGHMKSNDAVEHPNGIQRAKTATVLFSTKKEKENKGRNIMGTDSCEVIDREHYANNIYCVQIPQLLAIDDRKDARWVQLGRSMSSLTSSDCSKSPQEEENVTKISLHSRLHAQETPSPSQRIEAVIFLDDCDDNGDELDEQIIVTKKKEEKTSNSFRKKISLHKKSAVVHPTPWHHPI